MANTYDTSVAWPLPQAPDDPFARAAMTNRRRDIRQRETGYDNTLAMVLEYLRSQPLGYPSAPADPDQRIPTTDPNQAGHLRNVNAVRPVSGEGRQEGLTSEIVGTRDPYEGSLELATAGGLGSKLLRKGALAGVGLLGSTGEAEAGNKYGKAAGLSVDAVKQWLQKLGHNPSETPANWIVRHGPGGPELVDASNKGAGGYHNLSALRTGLPLDEMGYKIKGAPEFQRNITDIADYEGAELLPTGVDRMRGGGKLTQIGETKLPSAVPLEGGIDYPWLQMGKKVPGQSEDVTRIWANQQGPATTINRKAEEILEKGRTPYLMPVTGAKIMGDSSKQMTSSVLQAARQADLNPAAIKAIDAALPVKGAQIKGKPVRPYPGFASDELPDWLRDVSGPWRSAFVKSVDMSPVAKGGGPDVGQVRYANTDPRLVNTPTGSAGRLLAEMDPTLGTAPSLHSTYPAAMLGPRSGVGGLQGSVPFHLIAPDIHRALLKAGPVERFANKPDYYSMLNMPKGVPKSQKVTPEVVDLVSEFFRRHPQGWAVGGAVPLAGVSASQPQGVVQSQ